MLSYQTTSFALQPCFTAYKIPQINYRQLEPGIGGKSPTVTEPQFTTGNRFRPWLIIAIRNSPDTQNNWH